MNPDTLVAVCGYSGDLHQVRMMLPYYLHHQCLIVFLSPEDAPIEAKHVSGRREFQYRVRSGGRRAYIGPASLERQAAHLRILLEYPQRFFLLNDADSVCLSPKLPDYLYSEPNVLWSNIVSDEMHSREAGYSYPRLAFQPPYFLSREIIVKLVEAAEKVVPDTKTPFIDWCMMAWAVTAGVDYKSYPDGISVPTNADNRDSIQCMSEAVQIHGKIFLHSVKTRNVLLRLAYDRLRYKRMHGIR